MVIEMIEYAPEEAQTDLRNMVAKKISKGFTSDDPEVVKIYVEKIWYAPEEARAALLQQGLNHPNPEVQKISAEITMSKLILSTE